MQNVVSVSPILYSLIGLTIRVYYLWSYYPLVRLAAAVCNVFMSLNRVVLFTAECFSSIFLFILHCLTIAFCFRDSLIYTIGALLYRYSTLVSSA